eukprot:119293-Pleurochrysis_carterae.AAC.2
MSLSAAGGSMPACGSAGNNAERLVVDGRDIDELRGMMEALDAQAIDAQGAPHRRERGSK